MRVTKGIVKSIEAAVEAHYDRYERKLVKFLEGMRKEYVIPHCDKYGCALYSCHGNWWFTNEEEHGVCELDKRLEELLDLCPHAHAVQSIGEMIEHYEPSNYRRT